MKIKVVPIGNSRGIRIPKAILEQCQVSDAVHLVVEGQQIVLTPANVEPRAGWREAARRMAERGDDDLLIPDVFEDEDHDW
jgi:antitoxin MazE